MTTTVAVLIEGTFATATGVEYASNGCITAIDKLTAANEGVALATIVAQLISPDGSQIATYSKAIPGGTSWPFPEIVGHALAPGGRLNLICSTPDAIRVRASGRQFT